MANRKHSNKGYNAARKAEEQKTRQTKDNKIMTLCVIGGIALVAIIIVAAILGAKFGHKLPGDKKPTVSTNTVTTTAKPNTKPNADMDAIRKEINAHGVADYDKSSMTTEYVRVDVKDYGSMVIRLRSDIAPISTRNFQDLVEKKFYDGLTIHRVVKDFMIQGGDPKGDGSGNASHTIKGEFQSNGVQNDLQHIKGVVSMARSQQPDSASCQFFICNADAPHLNGQYAAFGYVVAGLDTVDLISDAEVKSNGYENSTPVDKIVIERIYFVEPEAVEPTDTTSSAVTTPETTAPETTTVETTVESTKEPETAA